MFKFLVIFSFVSGFAFAEGVTLKREVQAVEGAVEGWNPKLQLNSNFSIQSSNDVTGQQDGDTIGLGFKLVTGSDYIKDNKEWRNELKVDLSTSRTPTIPKYVKASDSLKYSTIYLYGLENNPKLGPYVSASVETQSFFGENVQATEKTYVTPSGSFTASSLRLTDGFKPITSKEAAGFLYKMREKKNDKLEFRLGLGAIQVSAEDQLFVSDSNDTTVTVEALESYSQLGLEYGFSWKKTFSESSKISFTGDFLSPIGVDIEQGKECDDCSAVELTNIEINFKWTNKINEWANIVYEYKAIKKPELLNRFQIQNGFLLNIAYDHYK